MKRADGHPDHDATGGAAVEATSLTWMPDHPEYPVWTWNWAHPGDVRVPWHRARRVPLTAPMRRTKATAIGMFETQVTAIAPGSAGGPILPEPILRHHDRPFEVLFT